MALAPFQLTYAQYVVLLALWEQDGVKLHQLGETLQLESNTLTPLLKRLETSGWLRRERTDGDRRQLVIYLTAFGRAQEQAVLKAVQGCLVETEQSGRSVADYLAMVHELNASLSGLIHQCEVSTTNRRDGLK
ncbi:MAG: MarR family transcriptional regulator [Sporolactobacillus sp.]